MKKKERQELLKNLLQEEMIQKQDDFVRILKERNIPVTQATISRDIQEMQLVKIPTPLGGYRYSLPFDIDFDASRKLEKLIKDSFISIDMQREFLLLKTVPGNAVALGSLIENAEFEEVFGVVSGDDTVLIICRNEEKTEKLQRRLIRYL